ncbi:MAG: phasin family protein [Prolixibacteraceae bacterium]|nr:phasin family protein [Burkholderiales bacterium]
MNQAAEKFVALNKKQAETVIRAFQIGFNAWEMLVKLNLEATRSLLQEGVARIQVLPQPGDMAGLSAWTGPARAGADKFSGYTRNIYEIAGQTSKELSELVEQTLLSSNQDVAAWVDEVLTSSSIPQPEAAAAAKAAMANAKVVIEGISKAVRQTAGYADANVRAAAEATAEAVKGPSK